MLQARQDVGQTIEEAREVAAHDQCLKECQEKGRHGMREVWRTRKNDWTCTPEAVGWPSQGDRDHDCPYFICDDGDTKSEKCQNGAECAVCTMMNKLDQETLTGLGLKRNQRLTAMLQLAPSVAQSLNSGEIPEDRRQLLCQAFCELLSCC